MMTIIVVRLVPGFMRHDDLELWLINSNTNSIMAPRLTLAMPSQCNKFILCMSWVISHDAIHRWAEKVDLVALTFELLICLLSFILLLRVAFRSKVTAINISTKFEDGIWPPIRKLWNMHNFYGTVWHWPQIWSASCTWCGELNLRFSRAFGSWLGAGTGRTRAQTDRQTDVCKA